MMGSVQERSSRARGDFKENTHAGVVDGGVPPLIKEGQYQFRFDDWRTCILFGKQPKVVLYLSVCELGCNFSTKLERWYNAKSLTGKSRKKGRFVVGRSSDLYREYATIMNTSVRSDRIALSNYRGVMLLGEVKTVRSDRAQRLLVPVLQYSIVSRLSRAPI